MGFFRGIDDGRHDRDGYASRARVQGIRERPRVRSWAQERSTEASVEHCNKEGTGKAQPEPHPYVQQW